GLWFDPDKLLVDPYARRLDRRFVQDPRLALPQGMGGDTAPLVPKAVVEPPRPAMRPQPPLFTPGGLIFELNVRGFTMRQPEVPEAQRGTVAALAHPSVIAHLRRLRVSAVELMPVVAWIDERHLPPLGLRNAWGYNPVALGALDPGLCPGGPAELAAAVAALREAGIGVILDLVFNHTGEADVAGPVLSLRGLDAPLYYAHPPGLPGVLNNDTGCGNTLACWRPEVRALVLDTLRHLAGLGVDGFRFDLAPVLARGPDGFDPQADIFAEIAADPLLHDRVMIAEPWDVGPGGYRLGAFPPGWLEWNDRFRDDVRRFVRGDGGLGALATRLAGSADVFSGEASRTVNFIAAHDGFTLRDLVSHARRHNLANGEGGRDGHADEVSWNEGAESACDDPGVAARRDADVRLLLAILFASRGTIMLAAGDEFGRTQDGNNNAYAQDEATTWLDWEGRDSGLEAFVAMLAELRAAHPGLAGPAFLEHAGLAGWAWLDLDGRPLDSAGWEAPAAPGLELRLTLRDGSGVAVRIDRAARTATIAALAGAPKDLQPA
ncbi:MAG: glycogen debranching enzyme, partial [Caulobacteraceae bacterium]|nr:glycogen debranching enzyme [Caulobacter sp.]